MAKQPHNKTHEMTTSTTGPDDVLSESIVTDPDTFDDAVHGDANVEPIDLVVSILVGAVKGDSIHEVQAAIRSHMPKDRAVAQKFVGQLQRLRLVAERAYQIGVESIPE